MMNGYEVDRKKVKNAGYAATSMVIVRIGIPKLT